MERLAVLALPAVCLPAPTQPSDTRQAIAVEARSFAAWVGIFCEPADPSPVVSKPTEDSAWGHGLMGARQENHPFVAE